MKKSNNNEIMLKKPLKLVARAVKSKLHPTTLYARNHNEFTDGRKPTSPEQWISLAEELMRWAMLPTSIKFSEFATLHKYSPPRFKNWDDSDYFVECVEQARYIVWARRERIAMDKDPVQVILKTMHHDSPEEQSWQERKLTIDKKSDGPQVVVIERYPETNLVPIRKKE
jgi:hypothetical protein